MQRFKIFHGLFQFVEKFARSWNASRCNASTLQPFNASTLCQINRGGDNDGDGGGGKFDPRYTSGIGYQSNNTNMAENKSSTAAGNTRRDNNCTVSDRHNS